MRNPFKRFWNWLCVTRKGTIGAILCGIALIIYVVKSLQIMQEGNAVDPSLTFCVFGAIVAWLITSALIRCNSDKLDNKTLLQRLQNIKFNVGDTSFDVTLNEPKDDDSDFSGFDETEDESDELDEE